MKTNIDGTLLGSWAMVSVSDDSVAPVNLLDVGTGCGLIALMLAQRFVNATVDAVEIDSEASAQAIENTVHSPYYERIKVHHISFFDFEPPCKYNLIVSNPPFFSRSLKGTDVRRNIARHSDALPLERFIVKAASMLEPSGVISLILPSSQSEELNLIVASHGLFICRRTDVVTVEGGTPKRFLVEITNKLPEKYFINTLTIETSEHKKTSDFKVLTDAFYLPSPKEM
jgi:tRNA1Val (adenine37-N6)-methyltransferase